MLTHLSYFICDVNLMAKWSPVREDDPQRSSGQGFSNPSSSSLVSPQSIYFLNKLNSQKPLLSPFSGGERRPKSCFFCFLFCFIFLPEVRMSKTMQDVFWKPCFLRLIVSPHLQIELERQPFFPLS